MDDIMDKIAQANNAEVEVLMSAVLKRYTELFPNWDISTISVEKCSDRNQQLDRMIAVLESMKTASPE